MAYSYDTLSAAVKGLQQRGYTEDMKVEAEALFCRSKSLSLNPADFHIDEFHRFEGDTDPGDESIIYAISSEKHGIKGILINAFGPDASSLTQAMVAKLSTH